MNKISTQTEKPKTLGDWLNNEIMKDQFAAALPKHMSPDRFVRVAITSLTRTPKLKDCSQESLFKCLMDLSSAGLEPDGRNAHLIPYGNECRLIIDYKGLVELVRRSGEVVNIHADKVCENDEFEVNAGKLVCHKIDYHLDRGKPYAYYCFMDMKDGSQKLEVMTKAEVEEIRKRSKSSNSGPWVTDFDEMAKKTVFRRASKWVSLSPEIRNAIELDDSQYKYISQPINITPSETQKLEEKIQETLPEFDQEKFIHEIETVDTIDDLRQKRDDIKKNMPDVIKIEAVKEAFQKRVAELKQDN